MAFINFLFGNLESRGFTVEGAVELEADITLGETHERIAETTTHPIEDGSLISDHIILQPERIQLEGFVTDEAPRILGTAPGTSQNAFDVLDTLWKAKEPVTVITSKKVYENMVITNLQLPHERPSSLSFSLDLVQVRITSAEFGEVGAATGEEGEVTAPVEDAGRQTTNAASEADNRAGQSILNDIFNTFSL